MAMELVLGEPLLLPAPFATAVSEDGAEDSNAEMLVLLPVFPVTPLASALLRGGEREEARFGGV